MRGDASEKKVKELTESITIKQNENNSLEQTVKVQKDKIDQCSLCRDSLEMKNALISNYHLQIQKGKKTNKILTGVIGVLTLLFIIK